MSQATALENRSATDRYGSAGFAAAVINILVLQYLTWFTLQFIILALDVTVPVLILDLIVAAALCRAPRAAGQIGRGMLIGCISAPLSFLIFVPAYMIVAG